MSGGPSFRRIRTVHDHSRSMSAATTAQFRVELLNSLSVSSGSRPSFPLMHGSSTLSFPGPPRSPPIVYPALLSRVAKTFRASLAVNDHIKEYMDTCQAVDKIAYIIQTNNPALPAPPSRPHSDRCTVFLPILCLQQPGAGQRVSCVLVPHPRPESVHQRQGPCVEQCRRKCTPAPRAGSDARQPVTVERIIHKMWRAWQRAHAEYPPRLDSRQQLCYSMPRAAGAL
ncbi:hypothetical protein FA95DRAFT_1296377 [Auriscalpium vulgare]|uniref:Uncharacterized protein n=1 Tax=Auriscalpium vulgare TaxID=40419 RepID=A0ACB8RSX1_9AGAM|nr:hypothetical protein FA95DRAFT_1296377 [Auriscalpium vulgare]